jgi:SAM-dependent methyltransferase
MGHGPGRLTEVEVTTAFFANGTTTVTFKRLGSAPAPLDDHPASGWTRVALSVHGLMARVESRLAGASNEPGIIHSALRYDIQWGWLFGLTDRAIVRRLGIAPGQRVLDLGCGPGNLVRSISSVTGLDGAAIGIDASPEMIERARRKHRGRPVTFAQARASDLAFPRSAFDAVVSRLLIHELPDDDLSLTLAEIRRVLRPGGRALLIDLPGLALDQARQELEHAGVNVETGTVGFPFFRFLAFRGAPERELPIFRRRT